jgi:hypothetical protein
MRGGWGPLEECGIRLGSMSRAHLEGNELLLKDCGAVIVLRAGQDRKRGNRRGAWLRGAAFATFRHSRDLGAGRRLVTLAAVVFTIPFAALHRLAGHCGKDRSCRNRQERPKKQGRNETLGQQTERAVPIASHAGTLSS